ncbi:hypothetical protein B0H17DRAFT_1063330 [Mycena rosella]|uniref:F-box domain-containing protein n=1 Tax=Mycena rosella TaxID=1033263 RepID=A0AAD7DIV7_MYCRO|nr:hypothetical protein B0H17DRAFT_1063330 [Mycena rosella]
MAPRKKAGKASSSRRKLLAKGNGPFLDLPYDILLEILKILHPLDLLYLSRTNKTLRDFLLDRSNASTIWRESFRTAEDSPPECPSYTCEPQWARLLFEEVCHVCESSLEHDFLSDPIWWEFGARYCSECCNNRIVVDKLPKKLTGGGRDNERRWSGIFPRANGSYLVKDIDEFMAKQSGNSASDAALLQERRDQTKILSDHAKTCRKWMDGIIEARRVAHSAARDARWTAISSKFREAGWGHLIGGATYSLRYYNDLVSIPQPLTDTEWKRIGPKLIAALEAIVKGTVKSQRLAALRRACNLDQLTENLTFPPRMDDVGLIPEVCAVLESDLKATLTPEDLKAALAPQLPELLARWSNAFEEKLWDHTRKVLGFPDGSARAADPFGHALAYFTCANGCCQGHFTGRRKLCPRVLYGYDPYTVDSLFSLQRGRRVLEDVIKLYGKDPQITTCAEMDAAPGKLWCMRCKMANQPTSWRDAPAHSAKFHEKWTTLNPRWEVEIESES